MALVLGERRIFFGHRIVFVPDANYPADFDFERRPLNKRQRLYESADPPVEIITAQIARMKPARRTYEEKRAAKAGITLEQSLRNKRSPDPMAQTAYSSIRISDEEQLKLSRCSR